jgi:hypothetical protein
MHDETRLGNAATTSIDELSLARDVRIVFLTLPVVLGKRGAH